MTDTSTKAALEMADQCSMEEQTLRGLGQDSSAEGMRAISFMIRALVAERNEVVASLEIARGALADIAVSEDMTLSMARNKARRIYDQLFDQDAARAAQEKP